jgi:acetoin utilization deacetylase AcuC-like enzyme
MKATGTALVYVPALAHTQRHHPENHTRIEGLLRLFEREGLLSDLRRLDARPASSSLLTRAHTKGLLEDVRQACLRGATRIDADTYVTPESYECARLAAGGCSDLVEAVLDGKVRNGLAVVRPPGHHAGRDKVGGFCLINNVAVAARRAQLAEGVDRILILDFDVHHGNGTQDIFYNESGVLFASLHLFHPFFYPGSGAADEIGRGPGKGLTLNVPFPPGVGDSGYREALTRLVIPRAKAYMPNLILVSAGFDAHWRDPLARALLSLRGYAEICRQLISLSDELCDGRIVFVLEGGYDREALQNGLLNVAYSLLGRDSVRDPLGPALEGGHDVTNLLASLEKLHLLNQA